MSTMVDPPITPAHHVDDALLQREFAFADDFCLIVHDRWLAQLATSIQLGGSASLQQRLRQAFVGRLRPYHDWHDKHAPFPVVLPGVLDAGPITIAKQVNHSPITLHYGTHTLIAGPTGTGKSTLLRHAIDQVYEQRHVNVIDLDLKNDRATTLTHEHVLDFDHLEFSPIAIPPGADRTACMQNILHVLLEVLWGAELQRSAFAPALEALWQRTNTPSLADWQDEIRKQKSDTARGAANRLDALRIAHPKLFHSKANLWPLLHDSSLYLGVRGPLTPATRLIYWWIIYERWRYLTSRGNRAPHTLVVLDEGDVTLRRLQTPTGVPTLAVHALLRMREAGITFWVGTPTWDLDASALANFGAQLILRPNGRELLDLQRHLQLTTPQMRFVATMPQGTTIGKFSNAPHAFIATFENDARSKTPTPAIVDAARRRTIAAAAKYQTIEPEPLSETDIASNTDTAAAREGIESNQQPTPSQKAAPSSSPPSRVAPVVKEAKTSPNTSQEELPPNASRRVALNKHAAGLLQDAADHLLTPTTAAYNRMGVHYTIGDRAKQLDLNLGLLEAHKVRIGAGRGKTASILRLTPAGWTWLGRKPPKGTRGGDSVAHQYYVLQLSRLIARSTIETLGADLVIPYIANVHEQLHRALEELNERSLSLNDGDAIAIEVECSRPEITAPRNIARNAGFALTVIAVLGGTKKISTIVTTDRVLVVDVLRLLDALRVTEQQ